MDDEPERREREHEARLTVALRSHPVSFLVSHQHFGDGCGAGLIDA